MFGRQIRCPIFARFNQGENVIFRPKADQPTVVSEYVMPKGKNTSWILKDNSLTLASDSQLAPVGNLDLNEEEEESSDETAINQEENTIPESTDFPRRSSRQKTIPKRYGFTEE